MEDHTIATSMGKRDVVNIDDLVKHVYDEVAQTICVCSPHNSVTVDFVNRVRVVAKSAFGC